MSAPRQALNEGRSGDAGRTTAAGAARLQAHLSRWLMLYALGSMLVGVLVGYPLRDWSTASSPLVAVPAATMPIFQVIFMVGFLRLAPRVRAHYAPRTNTPTPGSASPTGRLEELEQP